MGIGEIARRFTRPATAARRRGAWLSRVPLLLAFVTGWVEGHREVRGTDPRGARAAGEEITDLPPLPSPVGPMPSQLTAARARAPDRPDEPTGAGRRRFDEGQEAGPGPGPEGERGPNVPGITRFNDLRGLGAHSTVSTGRGPSPGHRPDNRLSRAGLRLAPEQLHRQPQPARRRYELRRQPERPGQPLDGQPVLPRRREPPGAGRRGQLRLPGRQPLRQRLAVQPHARAVRHLVPTNHFAGYDPAQITSRSTCRS